MTLVSTVGGASGPLYGTFFLRCGGALDDAATVDAAAFGAALRAGVAGVQARGKAELGDKTMYDAWSPALDAYDGRCRRGRWPRRGAAGGGGGGRGRAGTPRSTWWPARDGRATSASAAGATRTPARPAPRSSSRPPPRRCAVIGIVVVSHSRPLAEAAVALAREMVPEDAPLRMAVAAGAADGGVRHRRDRGGGGDREGRRARRRPGAARPGQCRAQRRDGGRAAAARPRPPGPALGRAAGRGAGGRPRARRHRRRPGCGCRGGRAGAGRQAGASRDADLAAGVSAAMAWRRRLDAVAGRFEALADPYQRERAADVRSVQIAVLRALTGASERGVEGGVPVVLVVDELDVATAASLDPEQVAGIVVTARGRTGHGAIVAASRGIPLLTGADRAPRRSAPASWWPLMRAAACCGPRSATRTSGAGRHTSPSAAPSRQAAVEAARERPAVTRDGSRVPVLANVGSLVDAETAAACGADGAGLVRTEVLFGDRSDPPSVAEQTETLLALAAALGGAPLTVRTWDVGGGQVAAVPAAAAGGQPVPRRPGAAGVPGSAAAAAAPACWSTS